MQESGLPFLFISLENLKLRFSEKIPKKYWNILWMSEHDISSINGWVRHNDGGKSKNGKGDPFQSNFGATKDP